MILQELVEGLNIKRSHGTLETQIQGIAYDSRLVKKNFLFVAVKGFSVDGHDFIEDAINRGASAIVAEKTLESAIVQQYAVGDTTSFVVVPDSRVSLALLSAAFYGQPSNSLSLIGITGTNGKTTSSFITKSIIDSSGEKTGLIGTISYMTGEKTYRATNTTPESLDLQRYLREMVGKNIQYAVLEVSSHAVALKRIEGCRFSVAAFTNFSQDHLDFHGTMDDYFNAKAGLFEYVDESGTAILNQDDQSVRYLSDKLNCNALTFGINEGADIRAMNIHERKSFDRKAGLSFDMQTPRGSISIHSSFIGQFNVYNILLSAGIAYSLGISLDDIQEGIENAQPVSGRFEKIDAGQDFLCIVDYAHTEDALRNIIETARPVTQGRVITVFGCGGDRDKTKRPLMGKVAAELSDIAVITSDNPRSENPEGIIEDILEGIDTNNYRVQPDRELALIEALSIARQGDTLLVAGKGHEDYQEVEGVRHHFDDKEILRREMKKFKIENKK